ncbi:MAG: ABC transporter ATP-binding protein [Parcubacteria group bacterium GW2011_GWA2_38_13]|nr:MAG: ABC transporter ATP-binding protein [Parcubacteria group bacterium GW2011_GWA2_38_13]
MKIILDELTRAGSIDWQKLLWLVVVMFLVGVFGSAYYRWIDIKRFNFLLNLDRYLPNILHQKLLSLSLGYHEKENTGNKIVKIRRGVDRLGKLLDNATWDFFPTAFQTIFTFIFILIIDWPLGLVFGASIPAYLLVTWRMNKIVGPWRDDSQRNYEKSAGIMGQSMINIHTVQSFAQERYEAKTHKNVLDTIFNLENKIWSKILNYNFTRNTILDVGRFLTLGFAVYQTARGVITAGSLVLFFTLSERVYSSVFRLSRIYDTIMDSAPAIKRLDSLMRTETDIKISGAPARHKVLGKIEFQNVSFAYIGEKRVLESVDFTINPGEFVALVGPSGAGKTTIVKLLYRHFDVTGGKILIDGMDLKKLDMRYYRKQLGIVTQDIDIFNDTISANIAYAKPDSKFEDIVRVAKVANAHDFIIKMKNGYDTMVGERGVKLSGGQKQRIGIARAILPNPKILVFDEATSSLDSESELMIQKSLLEIAKNRTIIVIAHRLSTIRRADTIFVFENGKLVERGTHKELTTNDGLYSRLHSLQVAGEVR